MSSGPDVVHELTGLYVLGALPADERRAFESHLATCAACQAEVTQLRSVADALPWSAPSVAPPPALRARVLQAIAAEPGARSSNASTVTPIATPVTPADVRASAWLASGGWLAAAASLVLAIGLGVYALSLRSRITEVEGRLVAALTRLEQSEQQLDASNREATVVRTRLAVVTAPDAIDLRLAGQPVAPRAQARAFVSRSRGVLFAATNLPPLPANRVYQVWFLTPGAPVSVGLLRPDADGTATVSFEQATGVAPAGMAVSIEPDGGVPAPTGAIYLATTQ